MDKYKIAIIRRGGSEPLYRIYQEQDNSGNLVDWETDNETELSLKISELLLTIPGSQIKPIKDMTYIIEVILNGGI